MLHRLCKPPSISLNFSLATVLLRRSVYRVNLNTEIYNSNIEHSSFRAWTTRVSNPVCSPCFSFSASVSNQIAAFAYWWSPLVSMNFTSTPRVPQSSFELYFLISIKTLRIKLKIWNLINNLINRLNTLYAQSLRITLVSPVLPRLLARS